MLEDMIQKVVEELKEKTKTPYVKITTEAENCSVFESKFGGKPYCPRGFEYPYSKTNPQNPLRLLAQINFEEVPHFNEDFPTTGILQFYVYDNGDYCIGLDFDNPISQKDFRVIYHPLIDTNVNHQMESPDFSNDTSCFTIEKEQKLYFNIAEDVITINDTNIDKYLLPIYNKYFEKNIKSISDIDEDVFNEIEDYDNSGHKIGGYPYFVQGDSRDGSSKLKEYSVLLLQIDSDIDIMWGDGGTANFFITPQDLKNRDFSKVLYDWQCC